MNRTAALILTATAFVVLVVLGYFYLKPQPPTLVQVVATTTPASNKPVPKPVVPTKPTVIVVPPVVVAPVAPTNTVSTPAPAPSPTPRPTRPERPARPERPSR